MSEHFSAVMESCESPRSECRMFPDVLSPILPGEAPFRLREPRSKHIAFSVSAGCFPYQMGVACYIQEKFKSALEGVTYTGASGGSWPAFLMSIGADQRMVLETIAREAPKCCEGRLLGAYGVYDQGVRMVFDCLFHNEDLASKVRHKLAISVTRLAWGGVGGLVPYMKDEMITDFVSNQDIIDCIIASSLIPFALNGSPAVTYRDWTCVDAGLTNCQGVPNYGNSSSSSSSSSASRSRSSSCCCCTSTSSCTCSSSSSTSTSRSSRGPVRDAVRQLWDNVVLQYFEEHESRREDHAGDGEVQSPQKEREAIDADLSFKAVYNRARGMQEGLLLAPDPYGILGLTQHASTALVAEMKGELRDALMSLRQVFDRVVVETLTEELASINMSSSPAAAAASSGAMPADNKSSLLVGMPVAPSSLPAAVRKYFDMTQAVNRACGKVASKVAEEVGYSTADVTGQLINTSSAVGSAIVSAPLVLSKKVLTTSMSVAAGAAELGLNTASATLSASAAAASLSFQLPWAITKGVTGTIVSALIGTKSEVDQAQAQVASNGHTADECDSGSEGDDLSPHSQTWTECEGDDDDDDDDGSEKRDDGLCESYLDTGDESNVMMDSALDKTVEVIFHGESHVRDDTSMMMDSVLDRTVEVIFHGGDEGHVKEEERVVEREEAPQSAKDGFHWREKGGGYKLTAEGGWLLEICPWTWRKQPIHHYHLSSDMEQVRRLFHLGYQDAEAHHGSLADFFEL